jgi:hypothetical protein
MGWKWAEPNFMNLGVYTMATTGELRAIIEELELVDIGDAASYLGEEAGCEEKFLVSEQTAWLDVDTMGNFLMNTCSATQHSV